MKFTKNQIINIVGIILVFIVGVGGWFDAGNNGNKIDNSTINAPVNQGEGVQNNYINLPKRNVIGIQNDILTIISSRKIQAVDVKTSTIDSETEQFAADIKSFITKSGIATRFIYCLWGDKLPDGLYYSVSNANLTIFVGANNNSLTLNEVSSLNICNMETVDVSVTSQGEGVNNVRSMEASVWNNPNPDSLPNANSYSTSSAIVGPQI